jgi:hypothetical protein
VVDRHGEAPLPRDGDHLGDSLGVLREVHDRERDSPFDEVLDERRTVRAAVRNVDG